MQEIHTLYRKTDKTKVTLSRIKRRILKHIWLSRLGFLAILLSFIFALVVFVNFILGRFGLFNYLSLARDFLFTPADKIQSISQRTNILILGKGGAGHDAPDLTDTIVFASIGHSEHSAVFISLPRDIWISSLRAKLNSAYYWGNQKQQGGGILLAKSTVEEIVGQPVAYALVIDFSGFEKIINVIGGIDVNVANSFTDEKYPIVGKENDDCGGDSEYKCRYETVSFERGMQKMDGATALKFVRSRNAQGDEGTDLARAARQEKVIVAIKNKVLSAHVLLSPRKLRELIKAITASIETDIGPEQAAILARRILQAKDNLNTYVLPEDLLVNPPQSSKYDNLYVFIPKAENWDEVQSWIGDKLK
jgi:LCP family protein required for cell wall assembly